MIRVQLICEGERDAAVARVLIDRALSFRGLEPDATRVWCIDGHDTHWTLPSLKGRIRTRRAPISRRVSALDVVARRALLCSPEAELVVLLVDTDGLPPFSDAVHDAVSALDQHWVLGTATPKIEA